MIPAPAAFRRLPAGKATIGMLLVSVFVTGVVIAAVAIYVSFIAYRSQVVGSMARDDAKMVAELVFEHLFSVMRKGWTRAEIDDVTRHIHIRLPHHEVLVVRGAAVARQYGDREGHASIREQDELVAAALTTGEVQIRTDDQRVRYGFPVRMSSECVACHTAAPGEINGVIAIGVPLAALQEPIETGIVHPMLKLALLLVLVLLLAIYLVLRRRVMDPLVDFSRHVGTITRDEDYSRDIEPHSAWPAEVQNLAGNFNALMGQVRQTTDALRESSLRDPLTGLFNRRHFDAMLEQAAQDALEGSAPFSVLLIDLDRFKPINDRFGHAAGDAMLVAVAKAMQASLRPSDLAARIGGDEFAVLALATAHDEARLFAERLRAAIGQPELRFGHEVVRPACSIGVGSHPGHGHLAVDVLDAADRAMYADKAQRRGKD